MKRNAWGGIAAVVLWMSSALAVDVTLTGDKGDAFPTDTTVTFTAAATNVNKATIYTFTVMDSTFATVGGAQGASSIFPFTFSVEDEYTVSVDVNNGVDPLGKDFVYVEAVKLPPATDPAGTNAGDPVLPNPDTGDAFTLTDSRDGVIQGTLTNSLENAAAGNYFVTDFGDGAATQTGGSVLHHYHDMDATIFVLEGDDTTMGGSVAGKTRKTLAFSASEDSPANANPAIISPALADRKLVFKKNSLKGKFYFQKMVPGGVHARISSGLDKVVLSWGMTLPVGFDVELDTQNVMVAVGNVVESIALKTNGTGQIDNQPSPYHAVKFKLPRLKKGHTVVTTPFKSAVSLTMTSADLSGQGFDTEGITPLEQAKTKSNGPFDRTVQVATTIAGVSYSGFAKVGLTLSSNASFGQISGRH